MRTSLGLLLVVLLGLGVSWATGSVLTRGRQSEVPGAVAPAQDLVLQTEDHVAIAATFDAGHDDRSPAVLLLSGLGGSRQSTRGNAAWLASLGYATLAIDFRGHGQSDPATRTFGYRESLDARAAFNWLKQHQKNAPVAVIGISLGGAASLLGDAGPLPADALVLQAVYPDIRHAIRDRTRSRLGVGLGFLLEPFLSFQAPLRFGVWPSRLSPRKALAQYEGRVLIIAGKQDHSTPPVESQAMFEAAKGHAELWWVERGSHTEICGLDDQAYRARIRAFLEEVMQRPT